MASHVHLAPHDSLAALAVEAPPRRAAAGRTLSATMRDYLTLTKPSIVLLLLITTTPAMVLAGGGLPSAWTFLSTLFGGMLAAGGACAVNMYIDRDIDGLMTRTRSRALPQGLIPPRHALIFGCAHGMTAGLWLAWAVNLPAAVLTIGAFLFYTLGYTAYLKRNTVHNTVLGGIAGAAPPLIGWTAVTGDVSLAGILLFLVVFLWQPPHFWALALRYIEDYRAAGIPMLPVVRGEAETTRQMLIYAVLTLGASMLFGRIAGLSALYFAVAVPSGAFWVWLALQTYRAPGVQAARRVFSFSTTYLTLLFASIAIDGLLFR